MKHIIEYLKGVCMGIANAVPGVSGGTIAVITKIYDRLLSSITLNLKILKKNIVFLICVVLGMGTGIIIASFALEYLFQSYNVPTQFFFIGIIIGSMPLIYKECTKESKIKPIHIIPFIIGIGVMLGFGFLKEDVFALSGTTIHPVVMIIMAFFSAVAMIIPGLSGALVLKALGGYETAISAVTSFDIFTLLMFGIGALLGLLCSAKIISFLFKKCRTGTYCVIMGLIIASIVQIYPKEFTFDLQGIIAVLTLIIGIVIPLVTDKINMSLKNKAD